MKEIERVCASMERERVRHQKKMAALQNKIIVFQSFCSHPKTTYHPDASGNNDYSYVCDDCGKEGKRL